MQNSFGDFVVVSLFYFWLVIPNISELKTALLNQELDWIFFAMKINALEKTKICCTFFQSDCGFLKLYEHFIIAAHTSQSQFQSLIRTKLL